MKKIISMFIIVFVNLSQGHSISGYKELTFHGTRETLQAIADIIMHKEKGGYMRFGDGDVNLANGLVDLMQPPNLVLKQEMRQAFSMQEKNLLKTLPLHCKDFDAHEPFMAPLNFETKLPWCLNLLNSVKKFWGGPIADIYSPWALPYLASYYPEECVDFLKFLKAQNCFLVVGNKKIPESLRILLFGVKCKFVPTLDYNSFKEIDKIENECLKKIAKTDDYKIIIISMGCSGRVLQKRLWNKVNNVFFFDFGSLMDVLHGNQSREWMEASKFDGATFLKRLEQAL